MNYDKDFFERLATAFMQEAEGVSHDCDSDGLNNERITVRVDDEYFEFMCEVIISDYDYEEDTNSVTFMAKVFCTGIPEHKNADLVEYMKIEFLNEYIYSDEG
jgi:hypothetical protein